MKKRKAKIQKRNEVSKMAVSFAPLALCFLLSMFFVWQYVFHDVQLSSTEVTITATVEEGGGQGSNEHNYDSNTGADTPVEEEVGEEIEADTEAGTEELESQLPEEAEVPEETELEQMRDEPEFKDMSSHWASTYVNVLYTRGIVDGVSPVAFQPDAPLTRAEMAKVIWLSFGGSAEQANLASEGGSFVDVADSDWFSAYVAAVKEMGIVKGYPDGTFKPNDPINRAETMKMVVAAMGVNPKLSDMPFLDVELSSWYAPYVSWAYSQGIIRGKSSDSFSPQDFTTRAEMAKIVVNGLNYLGN